MNRSRLTAIAAGLVCAVLLSVLSAAEAPPRHRTIVLTDIGFGDPDDVQSFVRLLVYSNELDIEGLLATASREGVDPDTARELIRAYGKVRPNLLRHAQGFPTADHLLSLVKAGATARGIDSVGEGKSTAASQQIIAVVDRPDPRPVWIQVWGAPTDLAQALWDVRASRSPDEVRAFVAKLRVYDIAGQDGTGAWICHEFPEIYWLRSLKQFQAISVRLSDPLPPEVTGANIETFTTEWIGENVRSHGPLGALYLERIYKYEGDTPAFLHLLPNGLSDPEQMDQGNWGGRFQNRKTTNAECFFQKYTDEQKPFEPFAMYIDAADTWTYGDETYRDSVWAPLFRWREAFQNDFAARMDWTITPSREDANHNPTAAIDGHRDIAVIARTVESGSKVTLDATGSADPDGDSVRYRWFRYSEPGSYDGAVSIANADSPRASLTAPAVTAPQTIHIILEVKDAGSPPLFAYRRLILTVTPE